MLPSTFALQVVTGLWVGWNNHARWIRTSAPRRCGASSSFATSACAHWVLGACQFGNHRASPSMEVTPASEARDSTTLVPTLPVAPVITMCILGGSPSATIKRRRVAATTTVACPTRRLLWQVEAAARRALAIRRGPRPEPGSLREGAGVTAIGVGTPPARWFRAAPLTLRRAGVPDEEPRGDHPS